MNHMLSGKDTLKRLWNHFSFSLDSISERVRFQKTIYLLSKIGFPNLEAYERSFKMYLYGPYSPELAKDAFDLIESKDIPTESISFSDEESIALTLFSDLIGALPKYEGRPLYAPYELLSDIIYWTSSEPAISNEDLFERIKNKKPYFNSRSEFDVAFDLLTEKGLI